MPHIVQSENLGLAFACVIGAAAAVCLGAGVVFFPPLVRLANRKLLAASLSFAAGVMIYVSLMDIFAKSLDFFLAAGYDDAWAYLLSTVTFFSGVVLVLLFQWIDQVCFQNEETEHQVMEEIFKRNERHQQQQVLDATNKTEEGNDEDNEKDDRSPAEEVRTDASTIEDDEAASTEQEKKAVYRMGTKTAVAVSFHNFPEGLATFVAYLANPAIGISLAIASTLYPPQNEIFTIYFVS
jgi:ZIP family zinc transporter